MQKINSQATESEKSNQVLPETPRSKSRFEVLERGIAEELGVNPDSVQIRTPNGLQGVKEVIIYADLL